jgi:class 3 adenylate cyclase
VTTGAVVNVASRVADRAGPGEVLVTDTVAELAADLPGIGFEAIGPASLKNVAASVTLFRARSAV